MELLDQIRIAEKLKITQRILSRWIKIGLPYCHDSTTADKLFDYDRITAWIDSGELARRKPEHCTQKDGDCRICNQYGFDCYNYPEERTEELFRF